MVILKKIPYRQGKVFGITFLMPPEGFDEALMNFPEQDFSENHVCYFCSKPDKNFGWKFQITSISLAI